MSKKIKSIFPLLHGFSIYKGYIDEQHPEIGHRRWSWNEIRWHRVYVWKIISDDFGIKFDVTFVYQADDHMRILGSGSIEVEEGQFLAYHVMENTIEVFDECELDKIVAEAKFDLSVIDA